MGEISSFTATSLQTISGQSLAVLLIVQGIKELPILKSLPTRVLAVAVGMILGLASAAPFPKTWAELTVTVLNGVVAALTAVGGWHVVQGAGR